MVSVDVRLPQHVSSTAPAGGILVPLREQRLVYLYQPDHLRRTLLLLNVQQTDDGYCLATHPEIMTHGVGRTPDAAAQNFLNMMLDLFRELADSEDVLAPHLRAELEYLREIVVDRSTL